MADASAGAARGFCDCNRSPGERAPFHRADGKPARLGPDDLEGEDTAEVGRRGDTGDVVRKIDPRYFRPAEVEILLGDPSKARDKLGWTPTTTLEQLVAEMVQADLEEAKKEAYLKRKGFLVVGTRE